MPELALQVSRARINFLRKNGAETIGYTHREKDDPFIPSRLKI